MRRRFSPLLLMFSVIACSESTTSTERLVAPSLSVIAPLSPTATRTTGFTVEIAWGDASTNEEIFTVQARKRNNDQTYGAWELVADVPPNTTSLLSNMGVAAYYQFRVRACGGGECSEFVRTGLVYAGDAAPGPALNVVATIADTANMQVTWEDNTLNETDFRIYRRERTPGGTYGAWSLVATVNGDVEAYLDGSVTLGMQYQYRVRVCNPLGCSGYTAGNQILFQVIPDAPASINITQTSLTDVVISWAPIANVDRFELDQRHYLGGSYGPWLRHGTLDGDATSAPSGGNAGNRYQWRLRACNAAGCSNFAVSAPYVL